MRVSLPGVVLATIAIVAAGCSDASMPTKPGIAAPTTLRADRGSNTKTVHIMDECDPATFDAAIGRPGSCVRNGGMKFDQFVSILTHLQSVPAWKFAPNNVNLRVGDVLASLNTGGEVHSFTEVDEFGGGIVDFLNVLSGNTKVAPECKDPGLKLLAPGQGTSEVENDAGDEKYQCCIHPWMRAIVHISAK